MAGICLKRNKLKETVIPSGKSCRSSSSNNGLECNGDAIRGIVGTPTHGLPKKQCAHTARKPCISIRISERNTGGFEIQLDYLVEHLVM